MVEAHSHTPVDIAGLAAQIRTSANQVDIRSFLTGGQSFPVDGTGDHGPLLQTAVNALTAIYAITGRAQQIVYPAGLFRATTEVTWKTGVGLRGESRTSTVFKPTGRTCLIKATWVSGVWYDNCHFADFTIDGADQTYTAPDQAVKGIFIGGLRSSTFNRVDVLNAWATGFGVDYLDKVWFADCTADNCGRGVRSTSPWGTGAGFGFSTGLLEVERISVVNCISTNNTSWGFFTQKTTGKLTRSTGFKMTACSASGNWGGFADEGCDGAIVTACDLSDNRFAGVMLGGQDVPTATEAGGQNGILADCVMKRNGANTAAEGGVTTGGGVVVYNTEGGAYRIIDCVIEDNTGPGVWGPAVGWVGSDFEVSTCHLHRNTGPAIKMESTKVLNRPRFFANEGRYNGGIGGDGIYIASPTIRPEITDNKLSRQTRGIVLDGSGIVCVEPRIHDNDLADCVKSIVTVQTVTDSTNVRDNILATATTVKNYCTNPNLGTDSTGYVSTGGFTASRTTDAALATALGVGTAYMRTGTAPVASTVVHRGPTTTVVTGEVWTISCWARATADRSLVLTLTDGTSSAALTSTQKIRATGGWQRLALTVVIPSGTTSMRATIGRSQSAGSGPSAIGDELSMAAVQYTKGANTYDYFDGSYAGCAWDGTANASTSTKTV